MTEHTLKILNEDKNRVRYETVTPDGRHMNGAVLSFREIHLNGAILPAGLIGGVGTDPQYRRSGLVRESFAEMAAECARRAVPLTVLHPFSFAYYRKFGFERVADHRVLEFPITALSFLPRYPDLIRCADQTHSAELAEAYNTFAKGRNLLPCRTAHSYPGEHNGRRIYLSRDSKGIADGYLILELEQYFSVNRMVSVNLHVHELVFTTPAALDKLLGFLRMYEGEMETVKLHNTAMAPEIELRLRHYMHTSITVLPDIMARINDVKAVLEALQYPAKAGSFTVRTTEPETSPWPGDATEGTWRVDYAEGKATVTKLPDGSDYDLSADIPALTQLVFGYGSYGYEIARYTEHTEFRNPAPDFFRAFPPRPAGIFEHF